ncbi:hypothetical protein RCJ22_34520 [Vibrio sp. FNV 38]|nr:hypothetical protein [Vibrio sp. FNV 38]
MKSTNLTLVLSGIWLFSFPALADVDSATESRASGLDSGMSRSNIWDNVTLRGYDAVGDLATDIDYILNEQLKKKSDKKDEKPWVPKRTRALTGYEYEEITFGNHGNQKFHTMIFADGSTRINQNFSIGYVLKERRGTSDDPNYVKQSAMQLTEIIPRYTKWVNENLTLNAEFKYKKQTGPREKTVYAIKPSAYVTYDKFFMNLQGEVGYWEEDDAYLYKTEPLFLYRPNNWFSFGAKALYIDEQTDWGYNEVAVKPLVQFRLPVGYLELRYENGYSETSNGNRYDYNNYAFFTEIPITRDLAFLADVAYRDAQESSRDPNSWGDRKVFFSKIGLVWSY